MKITGLNDKEPVLTDEDFCLFRELIEREFGIFLKEDRGLTFHTRLMHRLFILGFSTYKEYYNYIVSDSSKKELYNLVSHLTNNETYFMRERIQIEVFTNSILKEIKNRRIKEDQKEIRILSAGCSTGEEVYSINISLIETGLFSWGWDVKIIGVDVSENALRKARNGVYSRGSFRMLNDNEDFMKRFQQRDDKYIVRNIFRKNIEFIRGNVLDESLFRDMIDFDVIFCRNVMIYMSDEAIQRVARNFYKCLVDEGFLFIGTSESLLQKTDLFIPELREGVIVYRKNLS